MAWIGRDLKDLRVPNANQAMGSRGPIGIKIPLKTGGLDNWKCVVQEYRSDPLRVAKRFETTLKAAS